MQLQEQLTWQKFPVSVVQEQINSVDMAVNGEFKVTLAADLFTFLEKLEVIYMQAYKHV